ncbi:universal stress protein [Shinella sp. PSBB067]|uniref:universal stress protein n=1 Tax=Shinella sp. PSBB067 TaxID=2715959 RepID=UPI00193B188C|nr:universal stress protein [Shinella sp. PSBB067]QRI63985.1 universal stress protein [Shinella sp. PSBB067]
MSYKSILVNLDVDGSIASIVKTAVEVARGSNARLIGFCAADAYLPVTGPEGAVLAAEVMRQMQDDDRRRFSELREEFEKLVFGAVETEWRDAQENPTYALVQVSRMADLILTEAREGAATGNRSRMADPASVVLQAGRPLLIAGAGAGAAPAPGRKVAIAWKDAREARRAVVDAVPLLRHAEEVTVVTVAATIDQWAREGVADVAAFLASHGITARKEAIESARESERLLEFIDANEIDLVVSGAFGHSRLREWAFGGVTRSLLDEKRLNRFMSS